MATVYRAHDLRLGREVALKIMHDHLAEDEQFAARFVREARAAARMSHPNIVQVFDQGTDSGVLYLAMEYLPGRTLRDVLNQRGPFAPTAAVAVLDAVLDALASAHRAGIIHRDVKPENVILTDDGRVKVADFGLARAATATTSTTGTLIGTPAYLAPELVTRGITDARADVYAAGILLFEMLTGRQPFTGEVPLHVAFQHVHEDIPPPSTLVPGLPPELDDLVAVATARNPSDRPADANALLALVRGTRTRMPEPARDPGPAGDETQVVGPGYAAAETRVLRRQQLSRHGLRAASRPRPLRGLLTAPGRTRLVLSGALGLLLFVVLLVAWWNVAGPGTLTDVPRVVGMPVGRAQGVLTEEGLRSRTEEVYSDTVPVGRVTDTRPRPGAGIRLGGVVLLSVSRGSRYVEVPDVGGRPVEKATAQLEKEGLRVGRISRARIGDVAKGRVISSSPAAHQVVPRDSTIDLVISDGPPLWDVPDVVGRGLEKARELLEEHGFETAVEYTTDDDVKAGRVISQDPQVQQTPSGTVSVVISQGDRRTKVPDVVGSRVEDARRRLEEAGFVVEVQGAQLFGRVVQQDPPPRRKIDNGSTVTVFAP
jgi:serine/threonine-protein kinase